MLKRVSQPGAGNAGMTKSKPTKKAKPQSFASTDNPTALTENAASTFPFVGFATSAGGLEAYVDLYELAPVGYLTLTDTGIIDEINLAGAALLGEERQHLVQRRFSVFISAGDSERWHRSFSTVLKQDYRESCELEMQRGDGTHFYAKLDCLRSATAHAATSVRVILSDITERKRTEQLLIENEKRLGGIVNQVVVGIVQSDPAGRFTFVNDAFCEITGYTREEMLGKRWQDLTDPEDLQNSIGAYKQMVQDGKPLSFEKRYIRKNGKVVWVSISASRLSDAEGHVAGGVAVVVDITKRRRAEDALRKSSEEIEDLYNHAPCGYHSLDKDGVICRINDTELAWLGYTRDEVVGKMKATDLYTSASQQNHNFPETYQQFIKRGFVHDLELDMIRKDGTVFSSLVNATAVYDDNGEYIMSRSTVQDITARKRAEQDQRIAAIAFQSQEGIMVTDADGVILRVNDAFTRITGYSAEEAVGRTPAILRSGLHDESFYRNMWAGMKEKHYWQGEMLNKRKDGDIYPEWQTISAVMAPDGNISHYIGTMTDITKQKQMERELLERRKEMNDLLNLQVASQTAAAFAHELNQPLLAIASYCSAALMLLQAKEPNLDKVRNAIEASERQAHRGGKSIRDLLEFLSIKKFTAESFDLNKEIHDVLDTARAEHELKFHARLKLEKDLPPVRANRMHVQKVLLNLLHNSIDAMQEAGVPLPSITVAVRTINDENVAQVTLQDNGPGISKEHFQRLFEPFFTTKAEGFGMGLAICRSLIEANGGQLWIDPQEGPGATFHFTLPFAT
jgi:PAS domain S-box-containing protein